MVYKKILLSSVALASFVIGSFAYSQSKMPQVLAETDLPQDCKEILLTFSEKLIGPKKHRILRNKTPHSDFFEAFMLLSYNDQDSHVFFTAVPRKEGCEVSYSESFEINVPCMEARESLFKRWQVIGEMSETTMIARYDYPRNRKQLPLNEHDRAMAHLTQTRNGKSCLVTKKQQHIQLPSKD